MVSYDDPKMAHLEREAKKKQLEELAKWAAVVVAWERHQEVYAREDLSITDELDADDEFIEAVEKIMGPWEAKP